MPYLAHRLLSPYLETFLEYCERCGKVTEHYLIQRSLTDQATGLQGTSIIECRECGEQIYS